jgi:hypothetical protein
MTRSFAQIVILGAVIICVVDAALSVISQQAQIPYSSFIPISILIVGIFGFVAARRCGLLFAPLCGAILGLVDSTIGWSISWYIGPGDPGTEVSLLEIAYTIVMVTAMDAVFGFIGGLFSTLFPPQSH